MSFSWFLRPTDVALRGVALPSDHRSVALRQTHDPVEVPLVDNSAVVRRAFGVGAVKLLEWTGTFFFFYNSRPSRKGTGKGRGNYQQSQPDALHHPALDAGFTQDVVRSDARLTAVDELAPGDAPAHRVGRTRQGLIPFLSGEKSHCLLSERLSAFTGRRL